MSDLMRPLENASELTDDPCGRATFRNALVTAVEDERKSIGRLRRHEQVWAQSKIDSIPSSTCSFEVEECLGQACPWMLHETEKICQCLHAEQRASHRHSSAMKPFLLTVVAVENDSAEGLVARKVFDKCDETCDTHAVISRTRCSRHGIVAGNNGQTWKL